MLETIHVCTYINMYIIHVHVYVLTCFMHVASQSGFYLGGGGGGGGWCGHSTPLGTLGGICHLCN